MTRLFFTVFVLFLAQFAIGQEAIYKLEFKGLKRTQEQFLVHYLGNIQAADSSEYRQEVEKALWYLQIFSDVKTSWEPFEEILYIDVAERWTLLPMFNGGYTGEKVWFELGANEFNFLGRRNQLGGSYKNYRGNSFQLYYVPYYVGNTRWGALMWGGIDRSLENTFYSGEAVREFRIRRFVSLLARKEFGPQHEMKFGWVGEDFEYSRVTSEVQDFCYTRTAFRIEYAKGNLFTAQDVERGWRINSVLEVPLTYSQENARRWRVEASAKKMWSKNGWTGGGIFNLRTLNQSVPTHAPYFLGSFNFIRGVGDQAIRAWSTATINIELRKTLWKDRFGIYQPAIFVDNASFLRDDRKEMEYLQTTGLGLRWIGTKLYNTVIRIDYGVSLTDSRKGWSVGINQFF